MSKITVMVADATLAQLTAFAEQSLGIEIKPATPLHVARAKILSAWSHPDFTLDETDALPSMLGTPPKGEIRVIPKKDAGADVPKVRIILNKHERPGGDRGEFVAVNGSGMIIPRGEPCDVPYHFFDVLQKAVETHYIDQGDGTHLARDVPAFQYSVLRMPDQRAIDAYLERSANVSA